MYGKDLNYWWGEYYFYYPPNIIFNEIAFQAILGQQSLVTLEKTDLLHI